MSNAPPTRIIRFGIFEADLQSLELRRAGLKVRIQELPFRFLAILLERPGEVITREELREKLWPANTFVDFEHGLGVAVQKVRAALGDSAENSRFVETIPRRGYRFVAPVEATGGADHTDQGAVSITAATVPVPAVKRQTLVRVASIAGGLAVLALTLGIGWLTTRQPTPPPGDT